MGVQLTIQGGSVFNKGFQYTMDVNRPRVQFTMGFKIPYDTDAAQFEETIIHQRVLLRRDSQSHVHLRQESQFSIRGFNIPSM
jgi:hypothetical protein